ncbi:uncharacterized protein BYT42DRAFT_609466 [Radiomyces spectabilis]|uniref:uncharacterized protein n=1 Tax=Radiomyces spectabilis TaxID=64574 RepID=UPI00221E885A|nr:uncharacterized protein BYT42DRAFT_609466 [Radiomyces spectabilis]KAI8393695.1 hypothetical protein BYT42DRAFT_609466 [Radiomyces spectabilis]
MRSLWQFLHTHNISQYYNVFIQAGATDDDLNQLLHFNDQELDEFLQAINVLPFHCIKLKCALRELRLREQVDHSPPQSPSSFTRPALASLLNNDDDAAFAVERPPSPPLSASPSHTVSCNENAPSHDVISRQIILSHAVIYGKNNSRSLTSYEIAINQAAAALALDDPSLIKQKGQLFQLAKQRLLEDGYQYRRGHSRSKLTDALPQIKDRRKSACLGKLKRREHARRMSEERLRKIRLLDEQVRAVSTDIQRCHAEICRNQTNQVEVAPSAIEIQLRQHQDKRSRLVRELRKLRSQERKHQWYERRKAHDSGSFITCDHPST